MRLKTPYSTVEDKDEDVSKEDVDEIFRMGDAVKQQLMVAMSTLAKIDRTDDIDRAKVLARSARDRLTQTIHASGRYTMRPNGDTFKMSKGSK